MGRQVAESSEKDFSCKAIFQQKLKGGMASPRTDSAKALGQEQVHLFTLFLSSYM
jgi:hypothetical protein